MIPSIVAEIWLALGATAFLGCVILLILEWASGSDSEE